MSKRKEHELRFFFIDSICDWLLRWLLTDTSTKVGAKTKKGEKE